jgi:hypothetical protein
LLKRCAREHPSRRKQLQQLRRYDRFGAPPMMDWERRDSAALPPGIVVGSVEPQEL